MEQVFEKAKAAERVGFQLVLEQDRIGGLALCFGETDIYAIPVDGMFITGPYLCDKLKALVGAREASVAVLSLKPQLPHLNLDYESPVLDAGVAGYLLNPLKDTYDYDDLARDYLGMTVPSRADLLGKASINEALSQGDQSAVNCVCYMGYIAWKAMPVLEEKLKEQGMLSLFLEMEMPLIYSLYHMEAAGVRVDKELSLIHI